MLSERISKRLELYKVLIFLSPSLVFCILSEFFSQAIDRWIDSKCVVNSDHENKSND